MTRSSNDDRSDRYNPTSGAYWAAEANEASQRGDDDDQGTERPLPDLRLEPRSLRLFPTHRSDCQDPGSSRPTLAQKCGPLLLDRLSHFVQAVQNLLRLACEETYETEASKEARAAARKALEKARLAKERTGALDEEDRRDARERLAHPRPPAVPRAETLALGWREGLSEVRSALSHCLAAAHSRPACFEVTCRRIDGVRTTKGPGELETREFRTIDEALAHADGAVKEWSEEERTPEGRSETVRTTRLAFAVPARPLPWERTLKAIEWLVSPLADWWWISGTLGALRAAAVRAEWSASCLLVFGVRVVPEKAEAFWDCRGASSAREAAALASAFGQRGFRTIVVDAPPADGPVTWHAAGDDSLPPAWKGTRRFTP